MLAQAAATAANGVADLLAPEWGRDPRDTRLEAAAFSAEIHRTLARAGLSVGGPNGGTTAHVAPALGRDEPSS